MKHLGSLPVLSNNTALSCLRRRIQMMRLVPKRCTCVLLLLAYILLTVQLTFGSRNIYDLVKQQVVRVADQTSLSESSKGARGETAPDKSGVRVERSSASPASVTQRTLDLGSRRGSHKESVKNVIKRIPINSSEREHFAESKHFILESPFESQSNGKASSLTHSNEAAVAKSTSNDQTAGRDFEEKADNQDQRPVAIFEIKLHKEPAVASSNESMHDDSRTVKEAINAQGEARFGVQPDQENITIQRIERASDPGLHSQMRAKLKSLGSAVTQEQLRSAANKCGGMNPELRHVQTYDFVRMADHLCTAGELLALVAVHSNAKNLDRRATIRRTWGSLRYIGRFRVEVAFFLGRPAVGDSDESGATGAQLEALIDAESSRFGDIVQLNYTENYRNMTIKHLAVYEWLLRHCSSARYLVKVDDDTFTDVAHLATFLSKGSPSGFYCSATQNAMPKRVFRGLKSKWDVSYKEFPGRTYPTYCEGYGYILDTVYIADIYLCSLFKKFFWIDDVHVTGILASAAGVPVTRFWNGHGFATIVPSLASNSITDYIFLTAYDSNFFGVLWVKLWYAVLQHSLDVNL